MKFESAIREIVRAEVAKALHRPDRSEIGVTEYAAMVGKSVRTINRMMTMGRLPYRKVGKSVLIPANAEIGAAQ